MSFETEIINAAQKFKEIKDSSVGIISHNDTDGITSAAIISKAMQRMGINFQIHFITRTEEDIVKKITEKKYKTFLLLDYGSQEISNIARECSDKTFFVLDHHKPKTQLQLSNVVHLNPHFFGIDGGSEICAAGICFLFAKALNEANKDLIYLAIVGAVGDSQRVSGKFSGPNQKIFEEALREGQVITKKGLKFYGWMSRPLHKALEYSTDPFIPNISGSESAAVQFLQELKIPLKKEDGNWRTFSDLTEDEKKKLASALIAQRHNIENPADIFEEKIILTKFPINELREVEVLSAAINSCAKLGYFGLAVGVALGNSSDYEESKSIIQSYRKEIINAMQFFYDNENNNNIVKKTKHTIYFLLGDKINPNLISTVSTILSANLEEKGKILLCMGVSGEKAKISARFIRNSNIRNISLGAILSEISEKLGGEGGGHAMAAGATIPAGKEEMFINAFEEKLNNG